MHYPTQIPTNYQQTEINNYPQQQWSQQQQPQPQPPIPTQSDQSQLLPPTNNSFYQPPADQTQYIQPGFTSTPNPYSTQQPWYGEQRERLPSNEVCIISSVK